MKFENLPFELIIWLFVVQVFLGELDIFIFKEWCLLSFTVDNFVIPISGVASNATHVYQNARFTEHVNFIRDSASRDVNFP